MPQNLFTSRAHRNKYLSQVISICDPQCHSFCASGQTDEPRDATRLNARHTRSRQSTSRQGACSAGARKIVLVGPSFSLGGRPCLLPSPSLPLPLLPISLSPLFPSLSLPAFTLPSLPLLSIPLPLRSRPLKSS